MPYAVAILPHMAYCFLRSLRRIQESYCTVRCGMYNQRNNAISLFFTQTCRGWRPRHPARRATNKRLALWESCQRELTERGIRVVCPTTTSPSFAKAHATSPQGEAKVSLSGKQHSLFLVTRKVVPFYSAWKIVVLQNFKISLIFSKIRDIISVRNKLNNRN